MNKSATISFCENLSAFCGVDIRIFGNGRQSFAALCYDTENRLFDYCKSDIFDDRSSLPTFKSCSHGLTFAVLPFGNESVAVLGPVVTTPFELSDIDSLAYLSLFNDFRQEKALSFLSDIPRLPIVEFSKLSRVAYSALSDAVWSVDLKSSEDEHSSTKDFEDFSNKHNNAYRFEKEILSIVRQGLVEEVDKIMSFKNFNGTIGNMSTDSLRQFKKMLEVLLTLCSRAAIEGGVPPSVSYEYSDNFFLKIEKLTSLNDFSVGYEIVSVFTKAVRNYSFTQPKNYIIYKIERFVNSRVQESLSLKILSEEFKINKNYLSALFSRQTGKTLTSFIRERKIAHSKFLLETTDLRLVEIAETLSFSSQSAFTNAFREIVGTSPKAYRNSLTENKA